MTEARAKRITLDVDESAFYDYAVEQGWADGLPVVAPTPERVDLMIRGTVMSPDTFLGYVPPRWGELTVERAAVNAVMAGCQPKHFPVVLAAAEAILDEKFNLAAVQVTTSPVGPLILVNGPIAKAADVKSEEGCMGPGWRANMTIGRAIRLILLNPGGASVGTIDRSTQGYPGKLSFCFAENEEQSPFAPLHVDRGYRPEQSVVHVYQAHGTFNIVDGSSETGTDVLTTIAHSMRGIGSNNMSYCHGEAMVALCPQHANTIAKSGFSKAQVQRFLYLNSSVTAAEFPPLKRKALTEIRRDEFPEILENTRVALVKRPEDIIVVVAGGVGGHSAFIPSYADGLLVSREVRLPL